MEKENIINLLEKFNYRAKIKLEIYRNKNLSLENYFEGKIEAYTMAISLINRP
jgi:hypothetical protein